MRLTAKMVVILIAGIVAVQVLFARAQMEQATERYESDMRSGARTLGRLFRPNIARTWRLEGKEAALYLIRYTNETLKKERFATKMAVRWVWLEPGADAGSFARVPLEQLGPVVNGQELSLPVPGEELLITYVPVHIGIEGEPPGALEISESTAPLRHYVQRMRREFLTSSLILAGVSGLFIVIIGTWLVGRPLHTVMQAADRIGAGDLSARVPIERWDEIGALARTVNSTAERLEKARDRLARETESRIKAVAQLRHADRLTSVGTLAAGLAHELGTPLAVVAGRARLIADGTASGDDVVAYAESIVKQADKMARIIRQLLDFARRRTTTLTGRKVDDLARQTVELLAATARKRDVRLDLALPAEPVQIAVDGNQIQQVLTNLVMNAIDAMPDGGTATVEIGRDRRVRPDDPEGALRSCAVVRVRDQGEGIAVENLDRLFEPFFTTKPVGHGTGLGLAVSYGIVAEHGGWIEVDSTVGVGSTFSVYLPFTSEASDAEVSSHRR